MKTKKIWRAYAKGYAAGKRYGLGLPPRKRSRPRNPRPVAEAPSSALAWLPALYGFAAGVLFVLFLLWVSPK